MGWLGQRGVRRMLLVAVVVDVAYWSLWFGHRAWVASDTGSAYYQFENAFPLADAWLGVACLLAWEALGRRRSTALLWLFAAGGAGLYLFGMDVLYDLEHGIYAKGAGGAIEGLVNVLTLAFSIVALRWTWENRRSLLEQPATGARELGR